jgi:hypothetical protein
MIMDDNTKMALYAALGIAAVAGIAYAVSASATSTAAAAATPGSYTPSNGTHNLTVPVGTTVVINNPSGATAFTLSAGDSTIASTGTNTITGVKAGVTTISVAWTPTGQTTQQNDSVVVTVQ